MVASYRRLFNGKGNERDAQIVLADLADYAGQYQVVQPPAPPEVYVDHNARRAVFGRILTFLQLGEDRLKALEEAALREQHATAKEGEFKYE